MTMKKLTTFVLAAGAACLAANAGTTLQVRDYEYEVDTLFHSKVGPGTTQTSLKLSYSTYPLYVHYLTIDRRVPGVDIRAVCATDKVAGTERTSSMAKRKSVNGLDYFAGVNADFFTTTGNATNGTSKVGTPTTSCIVDGEIYKSSTANYQFIMDADGVARICNMNYYTGTATLGEKYTLFKGVNVMSPNNGITIYTPRFWGTANQNEYAGSCNQVTARIVEGDEFVAGGKFRLEVTSEPTTDGDLAIPADGFVIHGRGTSKTGCNTGAKDFVGALHTGDIVEFDNIILTPEGERIYPRTVVSGNPKNVGGGATLDTENERADASARHPRTSIGFSENNDTIIMMVIDGRGASVGVTTSMLADVMRFAGAYEAVNLDGGGSSTLYTEALGIRNTPSDGNERAVGNAVFAVLEAPEDNTVTEIVFADWRKSVPYLGTYEPTVYAFNKYGKMIDNDYKGFRLACSPDLGEVSEDGRSLTAMGSGSHVLKAETADGVEARIIVTVAEAAEVVPTLTDVMLNATREWEIELHSIVDGAKMSVSPAVFEWTSSDSDVATVTTDGTVKGVADGACVMTGTRQGMSPLSVKVTVEVPKEVCHHIETEPVAENWTVSGSSAKVSSFAANADHSYSLEYTLSATRGPKVTMAQKMKMWSHPVAVKTVTDASNAKVTSIVYTMKAANDTRNFTATISDVKEGEGEYRAALDEHLDLGDVAVYPLEFQSVAFNLGGSTNTPYRIDVKSLQTEYDASTLDVVDLVNDRPEGMPVRLDGDRNLVFEGVAERAAVCDLSGRVLMAREGVRMMPTSSLPAGVYVVNVTLDDTVHSAKIRL